MQDFPNSIGHLAQPYQSHGVSIANALPPAQLIDGFTQKLLARLRVCVNDQIAIQIGAGPGGIGRGVEPDDRGADGQRLGRAADTIMQ